METIIKTVDLAEDVKDLVTHSTVRFNDLSLKDKIFNSDDDDFLLISKSIGSGSAIVGVELVDDDFVRRAVLG